MQCTTSWRQKQVRRWLGSRLHSLVVVSLVLGALVGHPLEVSVGWVVCPPQVIELPGVVGWPRQGRPEVGPGVDVGAGWAYWQHTLIRVLARSELLAVMWLLSSGWLPDWVVIVPWVEWMLAGISVAWPWLGQQPEMRLVRWGLGWLRWGSLVFLSGDVVRQELRQWVSLDQGAGGVEGLGLAVGYVVQRESQARVPLSRIEIKRVEGGYQVWFGDEFYLPVKADDPFQLRQAIMFLRQLESPTERRGSRATRDGRRPLVSQQQLAAGFGVPQPNISRWEGYWLAGDWANLLSLQSAEVLTVELRDQMVDIMARFPWWGQEQVYEYLRARAVAVTHSQVRQAACDSGWARLKATLNRFFVVSAECIRPRDEGLVRELLAQVQMLLSKLEAGEGLTPQEQLEIIYLQTVCDEVGLMPPSSPPTGPLPAQGRLWAQKVKWILFAAEATAEDGVIRCTYCGSTAVRPRGHKPRLKRYRDENNQWQTVEVYRYRCRNPECAYGSFTHFPLGLLPYSPYRLELRLTALQMYTWGRSGYRRTAQALGVRASRIYQWVSAFGQELLPVAALFGMVRCSGVVGIDEKWVQVPEKAPRGSGRSKKPRPRRWMYVYFAVDVYTYDLLHIAIYAHNSADSTRAFLLALKAKGYKPRVIVTDLRREYGPAIQEVFSHARHHECIFHAMQWMHRQLKEVYGSDYARTHPEGVTLKEKLDAIFQVKTRRTAEKRYAKVMALRKDYVAQKPEVASVFDTLERHWLTLVNGIESEIIPRTNNAVELVIRRFDQHYQNFCGFESLETARLFLAVFEKVYRFTPFTEDAQPRIRGKCPLELAGYDLSGLLMAQVCRGWALAWPSYFAKEVVPNA